MMREIIPPEILNDDFISRLVECYTKYAPKEYQYNNELIDI